MYNIIKHIYNSPMKEKLMAKDDIALVETIPSLCVFKAC
jgi:hypothetical protein